MCDFNQIISASYCKSTETDTAAADTECYLV